MIKDYYMLHFFADRALASDNDDSTSLKNTEAFVAAIVSNLPATSDCLDKINSKQLIKYFLHNQLLSNQMANRIRIL